MSIVKINAITAGPGQEAELERRFEARKHAIDGHPGFEGFTLLFEARKHAIDGHPGFEGFTLLRPTKGETRYFVFTQWADEESYQAWRAADTGHSGDLAERKKVAPHADLMEFDVVFEVKGE